MMLGSQPESTSTHSVMYPLMENRFTLMCMNGRYVGSDLVYRTRSLRAGGIGPSMAWAAAVVREFIVYVVARSFGSFEPS